MASEPSLLVASALSGNRRAAGRLISMIEDDAPQVEQIMRAVYPHTGNAYLIGFTGPPGAGKSTLVDELVRVVRTSDQSVGIIAVDPNSPFTGGAILGDRIRMMRHATDPQVFIRSMGARGHLGGLAVAAQNASFLFDAMGMSLVLVETVGVGQSELEIAEMADTTVVVMPPGFGDGVQAIKAGIMEIADIFVINKSDREGAERVEREIRALQSLALRQDGWTPSIVKTVASEGTGVDDLAAAIASYVAYLQKENLALKKSVQNWQERLVEMLRDVMLEKARAQLGDGNLANLAAEVAEHKRDPYTLVEEIAAKARNT
jgi:LAO/AO transport system kinase